MGTVWITFKETQTSDDDADDDDDDDDDDGDDDFLEVAFASLLAGS